MGGGTRVTTSTSGPWKGQERFLKYGFENAKNLFQKNAPDYYANPTLAGFDPSQTSAHDATMTYAMGERPAAQQAAAEQQLLGTYNLAQNLGQAGGAASDYGAQAARYGLTQQDYAGMTPFQASQMSDMLAGKVNTSALGDVTSAMSRDVLSNLTGTILPKIRESQIGYQPGGSSRGDLVTSKAVTGATSKLADQASRMYADAFSAAQDRRLPAGQMALGAQQQAQQYGLQGAQAANQAGQLGMSALSAYPSIMNAPLSMYKAMGDVGASRRAMSQAEINADIAKYNYDSTKDYQHLGNFMNMIQGNYGGQSTITQPGQSGLSSLGQIASIAAPFFGSDIRIKENIEHDGTWRSGIREYNVYNFNYVGDDTPRRGVMAQEVEMINKDAVVEVDGIKVVNYGAL